MNKNDLRNEQLRVMISAFINQCKNDDELIEMCVEIEQVLDTIKQYVNERHDLNRHY